MNEKDPTGRQHNEPGAKVDAGKVRMHLITGGMARAITEVAKVGTMGAAKYTDGGWVHVPDGFRRYEDAQQRHAASRHMGEENDSESGLCHLAHEAWNALAKLDLFLRAKEAEPKLTVGLNVGPFYSIQPQGNKTSMGSCVSGASLKP